MKFCNLSDKILMVLEFKPILNLKFMVKESKTLKLIKESKKRMRLT